MIRNKYRIDGQLGAGGMGTVYLATDLTLGRQVAIKVLDPRAAHDNQNRKRFEHEAKVARHLTHPNTIQIFDFGRIENGLPFIVMEYLRGTPLDSLIEKEGALPLPRALHIGKQILSSLSEAHANSVIHRDLKPANVIVGEFGGKKDFAKVLDFGIAKLIDSTRDSCSLKTRTGLVIGSPAYMAPERIRGEKLTPRSDLFSFGILLVEMLVGHSLYSKMNPIEVLSYLLEPTALPVPDWLRAGPAGDLLVKATQKRPESRFASAAEMIHVIDSILAGGHQSTPRHGHHGNQGRPAHNPAQPRPAPAPAPAYPQPPPQYPEAVPTTPIAPLPDDGPGPPNQIARLRQTDPLTREVPGLWSNPINILLLVLILLLLVGTGILVSLVLK